MRHAVPVGNVGGSGRGGATHLIDAPELEVDVKVLLIQGLQAGVEQPAQQGALDLLDDLRAGLFRVVLRDGCAEPVVVHVVLAGELVARALDEAELGDGDGERGEDGA